MRAARDCFYAFELKEILHCSRGQRRRRCAATGKAQVKRNDVRHVAQLRRTSTVDGVTGERHARRDARPQAPTRPSLSQSGPRGKTRVISAAALDRAVYAVITLINYGLPSRDPATQYTLYSKIVSRRRRDSCSLLCFTWESAEGRLYLHYSSRSCLRASIVAS